MIYMGIDFDVTKKIMSIINIKSYDNYEPGDYIEITDFDVIYSRWSKFKLANMFNEFELDYGDFIYEIGEHKIIKAVFELGLKT